MYIRINIKYKKVDLFVCFVVVAVVKRIFYHTVKVISKYSERKEKKVWPLKRRLWIQLGK